MTDDFVFSVISKIQLSSDDLSYVLRVMLHDRCIGIGFDKSTGILSSDGSVKYGIFLNTITSHSIPYDGMWQDIMSWMCVEIDDFEYMNYDHTQPILKDSHQFNLIRRYFESQML